MSKLNYKKIEIEVRELVKQGRSTAYQIATRLVLLLNESDSYANAVGISPDAVIDHLNGYLRDYCVSLEDMLVMLKVFPNEDQWNRPLMDIMDDAEKSIQAATASIEDKPLRTRTAIKKVEFDAVVKDRDEAIYEAKNARDQLAKHIAEYDQRLAKYIAENDQLKARVAELNGQVTELRRTLDSLTNSKAMS